MVISTAPRKPIRNDRNTDFAIDFPAERPSKMTQLEGLTDAQLQAEAAALRRRIKQLDDEKRALTPPTTPMRTPPAKKVVTVVPSSGTPKKVVPTSIPKSSPKPLRIVVPHPILDEETDMCLFLKKEDKPKSKGEGKSMFEPF